MLKFDNSRLRAQVIHDFGSTVFDITSAEEISRFADAVITTASSAVREMLYAFNQANFMARMPPKALSICFAHLPLIDLIFAAQVCRSWRQAALSEHALWSHIEPMSGCNKPERLHIALSRAGDLPLDMTFDLSPLTPPDLIYDTIAPFSRQIRHLSWLGQHPTDPWDFDAPNMEYLCARHPLTITDTFLGGRAGSLRCLQLQYVQFPVTCPALSTVTDTSLASTPFDQDATPSSLTSLFDLCPRLESLSITGITRRGAPLLPAGRAPASLGYLFLQCRSTDYDLMPHVVALDPGNFHRVSLQQCSGSRPNLERFARGAVTLAVRCSSSDSETSLTFEHSPTVCYSVGLLFMDIATTASLLAAVQPALATVQCAVISNTALGAFTGVLSGLPSLELQIVHIVRFWSDAGTFGWGELSCLSDVARAARPLRAITLQVSRARPSLADACHLANQLRALPRGLPPINIQGFGEDISADVDLTGLNVRFDVAAPM